MKRGTPMTWEQVRVGVFLIIALAMGATALVLIGRTGNVFGERYQLVTLVRSAAGLVPGAEVQLAGQAVGQVDRVVLILPENRPEGGQAVAVWLDVNLAVQAQIRDDSRAQVRTQGLLGDRLIDIRPGSAGARILQDGDTVQAASSVDFDALIAEGSEAVGELVEITGNLAELTRGVLEGEGTLGRLVTDAALYDRLVSLAGSIDTLVTAAADSDSPVMRMLEDDSLYLSIRSTLTSLDSVAAGVARGEGSLGRLLTTDTLYSALLSSVVRTDSILASLESGDGSMGRLFTDPELYEELLKAMVDFGALLDAVREDPDRYVPEVSVF
ncbi:MAG: MCE family protein [Gemmatimonadales bacterium]|nr:MAG: MCE family protein [Gemmatimonadales bacterium]